MAPASAPTHQLHTAKKPRKTTRNPLPQPWLPKPSGGIPFPPAVDVVATGGLGAVGAAFSVEDTDSEDQEGSFGGCLLAALLTNRAAGESVATGGSGAAGDLVLLVLLRTWKKMTRDLLVVVF